MFKQSAVIVIHELETDSIVLTKRSIKLKNHPGQVCFPGGGWEPGDKDLLETGLRELQEEIGVDPSRLVMIKKLPLEKTLGGLEIHPWLTTINMLQPFKANADEVAEVFMLPVSDVKLIANYKDIMVEHDGYFFKTCHFTASKHFIWGATARILKSLCIKKTIK